MLQSEQLDTRLVLAADEKIAAGLLIQRMPVAGAGNLGGSASRSADEEQIGRNQAYQRIALLAATLEREELLALDARSLLRRLFWEEDIRCFAPLAGASGPRFECNCSRERVGGMLRSLGRAEIDAIVVEQGRVEIACDFCSRQYHFDPVDVGGLFTPTGNQSPGSPAIN
jgi:molecular chaperone Hsp33